MDREAIEEAIEVLEDASAEMLMETGEENYYGEAIAVLRQALKTEQEPVAWISEGGDVSRSKRYMDEMGFKCNPLYTAPPKREWVGLTDEEIQDLGYLAEKFDASTSEWFDRWEFARALEAKLKEKNKW
jgi:hypothetical protein